MFPMLLTNQAVQGHKKSFSFDFATTARLNFPVTRFRKVNTAQIVTLNRFWRHRLRKESFLTRFLAEPVPPEAIRNDKLVDYLCLHVLQTSPL